MGGGWVDGWVDGWMGEWMGGPMKGEMGGWMDRWMDGWVDACRMAVCALHLHAGARLLRIRVAIVVHRTYLVERVAREVDPLEHGAHRAAEPVLGHHAEVGISAGARILLECIREVELPVLRALAQRLRAQKYK